MAQYEVNHNSIQTLLSWIRSGEIAIPEIQRPFVWDSTKVRDLIDSLYAGFPVGYIIIWKNPDVRLKDGTLSSGKRILIDGQQRITALQAAIVGEPVALRWPIPRLSGTGHGFPTSCRCISRVLIHSIL